VDPGARSLVGLIVGSWSWSRLKCDCTDYRCSRRSYIRTYPTVLARYSCPASGVRGPEPPRRSIVLMNMIVLQLGSTVVTSVVSEPVSLALQFMSVECIVSLTI
jgi:hypothetical protein